MSDESRNVEVVQRSIEAINARDLDATMSCFTDDVVFDGSRAMEGIYEGKPAYRKFLAEMLESLGEFVHSEVSYLTDGDRVIALTTVSMAGRLSGAPGGGRLAYLYELRDGFIARQEVHPDSEKLLRSLGLSE